MTRGVIRLALIALVLTAWLPGLAQAAVSPFWQELGGSASGNGVSQTVAPKAVFETSVAVGGDGLPVVAYTEFPDASATEGPIVVKRWTGSAWETLGSGPDIGQGFSPQIKISSTGTLYVAWLKDDGIGNIEIRLRARTSGGSTWDEVGGSDSPGGITGTNPGIMAPFSLALQSDGNPIVAFLGAAVTDIFEADTTPALVDGTFQVYVRRWNGSAWEFVGSDFTGGGASNAVSFLTGAGTMFHGADIPSLTIDSTGAPVVAFSYFTFVDDVPAPNADIYVTRWNGSAWAAVGPAVPSGDGGAGSPGRGGAGGISNSADGSFNPSIAPDASGRLALAWEEELSQGEIFVWVRVWNGVDTWQELAGSASGSGFTLPGTTNVAPQIGVGPDSRPIVVWQALTDVLNASQTFVRKWNGTDTWEELGFHSAGDAGISDATIDAVAPVLALTPSGGSATAGVPSVAWMDVRAAASAQVFLRQYFAGTAFALSVTVSGSGSVTSNPIGLECASGTCMADFPSGTSVGLTAQTDGSAFTGWSGDCSGNASCTVVMTQARAVTASFTDATLNVNVLTPGGRVNSSPAGIGDCVGACSATFAPGTSVTLTATPDTGGAFAGWGGACAFRGVNLTCTLAVSGNISVTAAFKLFRVNVLVTNPAGTQFQGTVGDVSGSGISCGFGSTGTCFVDVPQGTPVVLQATPQPGNKFLNWSGGPCSGRTNATCDFKVTANSTTTALFRGATAVQILKDGTGAAAGRVTGTGFNCGTDCTEQVNLGATVMLTPAPGTGNKFAGWSGCSNVSPAGVCTYTATLGDLNKSFTATFTLNTQKLTVTSTGAGFVTSSPSGIECGAGHTPCSAEYDFGTLISLTPVPDPDTMLSTWTGCTSLNGSICNVLLNANKTIAAKFAVARTLSVSASGNGAGKITASTAPPLVCTSNCSVSQLVAGNVSVTLTPAPLVGTSFSWVGGDCTGKASCTVKMSANRSAVGQFTLNRHVLAVTNKASGIVASTNPLPDGFAYNCGAGGTDACTDLLDFGTAVTLQATPLAGFVFVNWTGVTCTAGATSPICALTLKANTTATPNYRARTVVTVVKTGGGAGTVTSTGINCGTDCSEPMFDAKPVTLRAAPATGSKFLGFTGDCTSTALTCTFTPAGNSQTVNAEFELIPYTIKVISRTNGKVVLVDAGADVLDCGAPGGVDCAAVRDFGTPIVLQATPIDGSRFVSWAGVTCAKGAANATCGTVLKGNITVTPTFKDVTAISLTKGGTGKGTIVSSPSGINCGPTCTSVTFDFPRGVIVKLTATPAVGNDFTGFSGECASTTGSVCSVNASTPTRAVGANFSVQFKTLRVTIVGNGSVTGPGAFVCNQATTQCAQAFEYGTIETLTPLADPGFRFTGWTQDCSGASPTTCKPLMTANHSVTATFKRVFGLTVQKTGNNTTGRTITGTGISCGTDCIEDYLSGTSVTLTRSAPPTGTNFSWGGDCAFRGTNSTCTLVMSVNRSVTADYTLQVLGLSVNPTRPDLTTVTGLGGAVDCGPTCSALVDYGTVVTLVAGANPSPAPASEFVGWTNCTTVSNTSCTFTMTANRTVVPTLRPLVANVSVESVNAGPIAVNGARQLAAVAHYTDGSHETVTTLSAWSTNSSIIATVNSTGLTTGRANGSTVIRATFRGVQGSAPVAVDKIDTLTVSCAAFGGVGALTCVPSGINFEVLCAAMGTFQGSPDPSDVTDQASWTAGSGTSSRGLVTFTGPIRQSFRINSPSPAAGSVLRASLGGKASPTTGVAGTDPWVVQSSAQTVTAVRVEPPSPTVQIGAQAQLQAIGTLTGTGTCASPPERDISLLVSWSIDDETKATVDTFGKVAGVAQGSATIGADYKTLHGDVPLTVTP